MSTVFAAHARAQKLIGELIQRTNEFIRSHLENTRDTKSARSRQRTKIDLSSRRAAKREVNTDAEADAEDEALAMEEDDSELVTRLTAQPKTIVNCTMRDYQLEGLNWMIRLYQRGVSGILADEMGLGKTLQTISLLAYLREYRKVNGPHLILVPLSTLGNWCNEFQRFCPTLRVVKFHGDREERENIVHERLAVGNFDVLVTTFEMASKERHTLRKIDWKFLIVDEAHRLKNENSVLSRHAREFNSTNRLLVTGTPLQNNLHELWALLNFLLPTIFSSSDDFDAMFSNVEDDAGTSRESREREREREIRETKELKEAKENKDNKEMKEPKEVVERTDEEERTHIDEQEEERQKEEFKTDVLKKLHAILRPFMLRRMKIDVATNLPPKKEMLLYVGMTPLQRKLYKEVLVGNLDAVTGSCKIKTRLANVVMQLRKAANHPYLFDGVEDLTLDPLGEHLVQSAGKMIVLDKLLTRLRTQGSRVLIFSQMTKVLDILEDYCRMRTYQYCRIDGNTSTEDREEGMLRYNEENSEKFVFLLSTRAGGLGINLATADTVVIFDSDWNPQMDLQAMDRAHRIGQKRQVNVYRFVTEDSIEERVVMRAETKLRLDAMVIQQGAQAAQAQKKDKAMSSDDMVNMIRCGAEKIFKATDASNISDQDIELILQRGEAKTQELNEKLQKFTGFNLSLSAAEGATEDIYALDEVPAQDLDPETKALMEKEAAELAAANMAASDAALALSLGKRERKPNIDYDIDRYFREQLGELTVTPTVRLVKPLRVPRLHDFQLFDAPRIRELCEKEQKFYTRYAVSSAPPKASGLTDEEIAERAVLLSEGFPTWKFTEFKNFARACEKFGRDAFDKISRAVGTKSVEEVRAYSEGFWKYSHRIRDGARVVKLIDTGEAKLKSSRITSSFANEQFSSFQSSREAYQKTDLRLRQTLRGKGYEGKDDIALLYTTVKEGIWDEWSALRDWVHHTSDDFTFNYFVKSRSANDIGRRVDMVTKNLLKNYEDKKKTEKNDASGDMGLEEKPVRTRQRRPNGSSTGLKRGPVPKNAPVAPVKHSNEEPPLKKGRASLEAGV